MIEPSVSLTKEKAFSVAAALPMPSYSSLTDSVLTNEEHLPFGQDEHSAHHIAQQLTLLQQVHTRAHALSPSCAQVVLNFDHQGATSHRGPS